MEQETISLKAYPSGYNEANSSYLSVDASYPLSNAIGKASSNNSQFARWYLNQGELAETYMFFLFDLSSIPDNAIINSVTCTIRATIGSTDSSRIKYRQAQMFYGTSVAKGTALDLKDYDSEQTLSCGAWTRDELEDCRIRIYAQRYTNNTTGSISNTFYGATLTVNYTYQYNTYVISTSYNSGGSISTSENSENVELREGSDFLIKIFPDKNKSLGSVILNGEDVTSDVIQKFYISNLYSVSNVKGASYNFGLNSKNYYESTNKKKANSASVCRVYFYLPVAATVNFYVINYAQYGSDYGILGKIDTALKTTNAVDSTYMWEGRLSHKTTEQLVTYKIPEGEHFVDVKYLKNASTDSNNDSLQFRINVKLSEEIDEDSCFYEYALTNIQQEYAIEVTFVNKFNQTIYVKENNVYVPYSVVYKKINGIWELQTDLSSIFDENVNYVKDS